MPEALGGELETGDVIERQLRGEGLNLVVEPEQERPGNREDERRRERQRDPPPHRRRADEGGRRRGCTSMPGTARAEVCRRARPQRGTAGDKRGADGALFGDALAAWRTAFEVSFDRRAIGGGGLAVGVGREQRIEIPALTHRRYTTSAFCRPPPACSRIACSRS